MSETFNAPLQLVYPAAAAMALSIEERRECRANAVEPGNATSCETPLNIGVFFDGTNNNAERDEPERAHSNVVRLFNAHPHVKAGKNLQRPGHYRIYVPGVGTPFKANAELRESLEGKALGKGGQARILYAVLQVFNSIHKAFQEQQDLLDDSAIAAKLIAFTAQTEGGNQSPETPRYTRAQWLRELNRDICASIWKARKDAPLPRIPEIYVSVFGFSRGAAEAVAFCHWLDEALPQGKIAGMPVRIGFLGLFDCVASVGLADSGRRAMGLEFSDGHFAWAKEVRVTLPSIVARVVHMMAAHEQRLNFPLTRIRANCKHTEFVYPGVHSDVGGGYGLGTQGRSRSDGELLSQIPLLHMHKAARASGVPLLDPSLMDEQDGLLKDYALERDLAACWNLYMRQADADHQADQVAQGIDPPQPLEACRDHAVMTRLHMRLYYDFRRVHLGLSPGNRPDFWRYLNAKPSPQEQEDIDSYNALLMGDLRLMSATLPALPCNRLLAVMWRDRPVAAPGMHDRNSRRYAGQGVQAQRPLMTERDQRWATWALEVMQGQRRVGGDEHYGLLGRYMHDSLAGFYLAGYSTREERSEKLLELVEKKARGESLNAHEAQVVANYEEKSKANEALRDVIGGRRKKAEDVENAQYEHTSAKRLAKDQYDKERIFKPEENRVIDESKVFPVITDADARIFYGSRFNKYILTHMTDGRREGGGYFLPRMIFE